MDRDLEPCAHCGGTEIRLLEHSHDRTGEEFETTFFSLTCSAALNGCGMETSQFDNVADAKAAWNRRALSSPAVPEHIFEQCAQELDRLHEMALALANRETGEVGTLLAGFAEAYAQGARAIRAMKDRYIPKAAPPAGVVPEQMWAAYMVEIRDWYGVEPKSFLGDVDQHKERFMKAAGSVSDPEVSAPGREISPAAPVALFSLGAFTLHSGLTSRWKIDCDALSDSEISAVAEMLRSILPAFGAVEGVPRGGLRLAEALRPSCTSGPLLIVDDVLTTGGSMEAHRNDREAIGAVIFARSQCPDWITPLFSMSAAPTAQPETPTPQRYAVVERQGGYEGGEKLVKAADGGLVAWTDYQALERALSAAQEARGRAEERNDRLDAVIKVAVHERDCAMRAHMDAESLLAQSQERERGVREDAQRYRYLREYARMTEDNGLSSPRRSRRRGERSRQVDRRTRRMDGGRYDLSVRGVHLEA